MLTSILLVAIGVLEDGWNVGWRDGAVILGTLLLLIWVTASIDYSKLKRLRDS